jgi:glyoxylase-like metal-dependent hydrolase (beta-lactamase superfamily II)
MTLKVDSKNPVHATGFFVSNPENGIYTVDTHHIRPNLDASHLIVDDHRVAVVDTGTALSVPHILNALQRLNLACEQVDWILLTHIHLDHAGGAGTLMKFFPNATVAVHPRGARHLVDPTKLVAATIDVYGEDFFRTMYGVVEPISEQRVKVCDDQTTIRLGQRELSVWHSPGHALHHQVFVDHAAKSIMAGDAFGVSYRELDVEGRPFMMPATTPSQLDPEAMIRSILKIAAYEPAAVFVTHYSRLTNVPDLANQLIESLHQFTECARQVKRRGGTESELKNQIKELVFNQLSVHGDRHSDPEREALLDLDSDLDAQGLWHWASKLTG